MILQDHCTYDDDNRIVTDNIAKHLSALPLRDVFGEHLPPRIIHELFVIRIPSLHTATEGGPIYETFNPPFVDK